uniref:Uncharacterized protein n=1 Tax=Siphoviridae sp. ctB3v5 TaxID=2826186 RepID=A0A8S5M9D5_9CAUD|nr:MAG TPA: hypothetical protein [Siphoviridae sp. ctB3v5]
MVIFSGIYINSLPNIPFLIYFINYLIYITSHIFTSSFILF